MEAMDPWVLERLRAWSYPGHDEQIRLAEVTRLTQQEIKSVDSKIAILHDQIKGLRKHQDLLKRQLVSCKSLLAPIRHLPNDILLDIFDLCDLKTTLSWYIDWKRSLKPFYINTPDASLMLACTFWHRLASCTPSLWSRLCIEIHCTNEPLEIPSAGKIPAAARRFERALHGILARTQQTPLDVDITISKYTSLASSLLSPLLQQCHRWRSLGISVSELQLTDERLSCLSSLESLETMQFELTMDNIIPRPHVESCHWFSYTPHLKGIEQYHANLGVFSFPWEQLQTLTIYGCGELLESKNEHVDILARATSLRTLEFGFELSGASGHRTAICLPNITSLKTYYLVDTKFFHDYFILPNLTNLTLGGDEFSSAFLAQVAPNLQRLEFAYRQDLFPIHFFGSNICFPKLTELNIARSRATGHTSQEMNFVNLRQAFPRLRSFVCRLYYELSLEKWLGVFRAFTEEPNLIVTQLAVPKSIQEVSRLVLKDLKAMGTIVETMTGLTEEEEKFTLWEE